MRESEVRKAVRSHYGAIAAEAGRSSCCSSRASSSCCGSQAEAQGEAIGYAKEEMASVPEGANLGLGCGNPLALAAVKEGQVVLDLGSGAGFDCFLAAKRVGERGKVIGVDMTPEMLERARENARQGGYGNVEFRLGEIESLPVADSSVDLVISNCVINLSPDKARVFAEAFRALKPGGRLMISDIVLLGELPDGVRESVAAYAGCIAGALQRDDYLALIREAGFEGVEVQAQSSYGVDVALDDPAVQSFKEENGISDTDARDAVRKIVSVSVSARKPL